ncbi:MAG: FliA/WhiG family RNA polymerase sigma factor [Phycisphaerae bacterium]|nr:FliA/WhiG family RNA polymerase sigma factor [Tepidisphaeraceae bacterium]
MPSDVDRRSEADRKKGAPASRTSAPKATAAKARPAAAVADLSADDALALAANKKAANDTRVAKLWKEYKKAPTQAVRNQLIENYLPLVRNHAERLKAKLPSVVQVDDLTTAGVLGLMDALEQFDVDRKVKFETFSAIRIRGAMMDELRGLDWVPRLVRQRAKILTDATATLRAALGRQPSEEELAAHLKVPIEEFRRIADDAVPANVFSIYGKRTTSNGHGDGADTDDDPSNLADTKAKSPMLQAQHKILQDVLTKGFTRSERLIVLLYYYEQLTMKEIGATLDLSESRVSQMHTSIVNRLRVTLTDRMKEFTPAREVA